MPSVSDEIMMNRSVGMGGVYIARSNSFSEAVTRFALGLGHSNDSLTNKVT